jgi:hypothetical protein
VAPDVWRPGDIDRIGRFGLILMKTGFAARFLLLSTSDP